LIFFFIFIISLFFDLDFFQSAVISRNVGFLSAALLFPFGCEFELTPFISVMYPSVVTLIRPDVHAGSRMVGFIRI